MAVRTSATTQNYYRNLALGSQTKVSFTLWIKISVDRNTNAAPFMLRGADDNDVFYLSTNVDGTQMLLFDQTVYTIGPVMTVGTWYFFGVSRNGTSGSMVWRSLAASSWSSVAGSSFASSNTFTDLFLSNTQGGSGPYWWNGCITAVKGWVGTALTDAQLQAEAWTHIPQYPKPTFWYPLITTETADYSGNGYTLSGGTSATVEDGPGVGWGMTRTGVYLPPTTVHALASAGTDTDVSTAVLAVKMPVAAVGLDTDVSTAVLRLRMSLSATGLDTDVATAALNVKRTLSSTGLDTDVSTAALIVRSVLASVGTDADVSTAALRLRLPLASASADTDAGTATLRVSSKLAATGSDTDAGTAVLHVTSGLAAAGTDTDAGAANLIARIPLVATGTDADAGTATFQAVHALAGTGLDADTSSAALSLTIVLGTAVGLDADDGSAELGLDFPLVIGDGFDTDVSNAVLYIALPYVPGPTTAPGPGRGGLAIGGTNRTIASGGTGKTDS